MFKKNLIGIVIVLLVFAGFYAGYMLGKGSGNSNPAMRPGMGMPPGAGQAPSSQQPATQGQSPARQRSVSQGETPVRQRPASQEQNTPQERPASQEQNAPQEQPGVKLPGDAQWVKPQQGENNTEPAAPARKVAWTDTAEASPVDGQATEKRGQGQGRRRPGMNGTAMPSQMPQGQRPLAETSQKQAAPAAQEAQAAKLPVQQTVPKKSAKPEQTGTSGQIFYGTAVPYAEANVQSKQGGTITLLKGEEGDVVKKEEVLVRFDDRDTQLELQHAIASKKSAEQQVKQAESNFQTVQANVKRYQQLFDDGFVSKQQVDDLQNQLTSALSSLNSAKESVKQNDVQVKMIENTLTDFRVKAPIGGLIDAKNYNMSEVYQGGGVIYHLIDIDRVYVDVEIPEMYLKQIREGMTVSVFFDAIGTQPFSGTLETILPSGTADNRSFTAKVLVQNPERAIKPGMFARIEYVLDDSSF